MRNISFIPGPSELYFTTEMHVKDAFKVGIPSISHRSATFRQIYSVAKAELYKLLQIPDHFHIVFVSSANEIWERIIQNLVMQESAHLVNGSFSGKFLQIAKDYGLKTQVISSEDGDIPDYSLIKGNPEMIAVTHNETSTGVMYPLSYVEIIRNNFPDSLITLDIVSSAPYAEVPWDHIDSAYFSIQKGMGLPAGLGVWVVNDACLEKAASLKTEGHLIGSYHSLPKLVEMSEKNQTPETPNVLGIYLLGKIATDMNKKGIDMIRRETNQKSALLNLMIEEHPLLSHFVVKASLRSKTVHVAKVKGGSTKLIEYFKTKGMTLGTGYGSYKQEHVRIANFPTHSKEQIELITDIIKDFY